MIRFAVVTAAGEILRVGVCPPEVFELQGEIVVEATEGISDGTHRYEDGEFVLVPAE